MCVAQYTVFIRKIVYSLLLTIYHGHFLVTAAANVVIPALPLPLPLAFALAFVFH